MNYSFLSLILLLITSSLFSAAEIALTSLNAAKIRIIKDDNKFASSIIIKLKKNPQKLLISILVGNQMVNVVSTVIVTIWGIALFSEKHISLVTTIFTFIIILFGSLIPKTTALKFPELFARIIAYPLYILLFIIKPIVIFFEFFTYKLLKLIKIDKIKVPTITENEIEAMLEISTEEGILEENEEELIKYILKFNDTSVEGIMVLLKDIDAINENSTKKELLEVLSKNAHYSFPVYEENLNNIKGIITVHELLPLIYNNKKQKPLHDLKFKERIIIPKTSTIRDLLKEFKNKNQRVAIIVDEHGQTIGLITLSNILEKINNVTGLQSNGQTEISINKKGNNLWEASGRIRIEEIDEELETDIEIPKDQSISLTILEKLKRFPKSKEKITIGNVEFEIKTLDKKTIEKVFIRKKHSSKKH